jgi:hypothetical protein
LQRKCACGGSSGLTGACSECEKKKLLGKPVQTELRVSEPGDHYEQEADRAVEQVMRMTAPVSNGTLEEPAKVPLDQGCRAAGTSAGLVEAPAIVHDVLASPGQPLDAATLAFFEPRFRHDFSRVRLHSDARSATSTRAVNARAYTVGYDIVIGDNQHGGESSNRTRLLAHELSHVVQQTQLGYRSSLVQRAPTQPQGNPQATKVNCDPAKTATLDTDLKNAEKLAQGALDAIAASDFRPFVRQAFARHFGQAAEDHRGAIVARYTNILNTLSQKEITCAERCEKRSGLDTLCAIGYENSNRIKICPDYWTAGFCKTYSTLLHEAVHNDGGLLDVKMTDKGYPPVNAQDNAYSYEYFAVDFEKPKEEANIDFGKKPEGEIPTSEP